MSHDCPLCRTTNRPEARFCSRCGEPLMRPAEPVVPPETAAPPKSATRPFRMPPATFERPGRKSAAVGPRCGRRAGLFGMMLLMGAMAFGAITLGRATRHHVWPRMFEANPLLVTDLDAARVDALFDLLKPEDVPVLVREDGDRLLVEGSTHRVGAVRDLVNILRRHVHRGQGDLPRETAIRKTYELSRKHAAALARALSYSHASIRVYRDENELSVTASPVDQQAISQLVRSVLRGREVRASRRD